MDSRKRSFSAKSASNGGRFLLSRGYYRMGSASASHTSPTLLGRLRRDPTDQTAWSKFVDRYAPRIYAWCRQWRLQEADAKDVSQTVLLKLAEKMRVFHYDPDRSFRGWLRTLT